ncbi:MAG: toll/interleukin-1 receptor domain-containing protein [Planctomycetota bacterium]
MTTRIFLSHSKADREWTLTLRDQLSAAGFDPFIDEAIAHGDNWLATLKEKLRGADWLCFVVSPESIASRWCRQELDAFQGMGKLNRIQVLIRFPAPVDVFTGLVQRTRDPLTPESYGTAIHEIVTAMGGSTAAAKLPQHLVNMRWEEAGRHTVAVHAKLQALVVSILGEKFADDALASALGLPGDWKDFITSGAEDRANALLVACKDRTQKDWLESSLRLLDVLEKDPRGFTDTTERKQAVVEMRSLLQRRIEQQKSAGTLTISRITDVAADEDLVFGALDVYGRIPADERIENDELIELTRNHGAHVYGEHWEQYFLVARSGERIVGMLVAYDDLKSNYTFVSGLAVRRPGVEDPSEHDVARHLLKSLLKQRRAHGDAARPVRIVAEVDDPAQTKEPKERRRRCSRLRHFATIAQLGGMDLRVPAFEFLQPDLRGRYDIEPRHLLLIYAEPRLPPVLARDAMKSLVSWIFKEIYPADSCSSQAEQSAYKQHAKALMQRVHGELTEPVALRRVADVLAVECDGPT